MGGPGTLAALPWSLETTRCGYKISMAAMEIEEDKIDVVVKVEIIFSVKKCRS